MPTIRSFVSDPAHGGINVRRVNLQRLIAAIRKYGPISRADLAKRTRLSPPTVSALIYELQNEPGLIREVGMGASSGGRPPVLIAFQANYGCLVGVDIGSRMVRFAVTDLDGRVLARLEQRTRTEDRNATLTQVLDGIATIVDQSGRSLQKLFAIGIAAPGMTDVASGRVISAANLAGWSDVPLRELTEGRFDAPTMVDNDANMAALGERWCGAAQHADDFVFLALGAGVGAGIVIGGRLHRGHRWYAGEISRMLLDYREWDVDFGERGYLESRIGAAAVPEWARARAVIERASLGREAEMRIIIDAAREGDSDAMAVLEEFATLVGAAITNVIALLDPALVVLGGGLSHAGALLLEPVRRVVSRSVPNVPRLAISALGDDAPLMGSVYSAMEIAESRLLEIAASPGSGVAATSR